MITFERLIEDTSGLSQGVPLTDLLLASIAISLKRIADQQHDDMQSRGVYPPSDEAPPVNHTAVTNILDRAHAALRTVDASDTFHAKCPACGAGVDVIPNSDRVTNAIAAIEEFARQRGIKLTEFR